MQRLRRLLVVAGLCASVLGARAAQDPWPPAGVLTLQTPGVVPPVVLERGGVKYSREAMLQEIQGVVALSCVVETDGLVGEVRVVRPLGFGLDEEAIASAKRWRFKPGTKDGIAVRVVVPMNIGFSLRGEPPPSTWPALFPGATDAPVADADWVEAKASVGGVTFRVPHPKSWTVQDPSNDAMRIISPDGRHFVGISHPRALPKPLPLPFPQPQLSLANESLSKVIGGHDFSTVASGQARAGDRWWLWQDQKMPPSAASRLPPEVRDAFAAQVDSLKLWIFITSVENTAVLVFCWAIVPAGVEPPELERDLRSATAVFDRMIKRMVMQRSASVETRARQKRL